MQNFRRKLEERRAGIRPAQERGAPALAQKRQKHYHKPSGLRQNAVSGQRRPLTDLNSAPAIVGGSPASSGAQSMQGMMAYLEKLRGGPLIPLARPQRSVQQEEPVADGGGGRGGTDRARTTSRNGPVEPISHPHDNQALGVREADCDRAPATSLSQQGEDSDGVVEAAQLLQEDFDGVPATPPSKHGEDSDDGSVVEATQLLQEDDGEVVRDVPPLPSEQARVERDQDNLQDGGPDDYLSDGEVGS
jgi:hypothetical protein